MTASQGQAWHLAQLHTLDGILQDMGYPTHLLERSPQVPQPVLLVKVAMLGERPPLEMALGFYPVDPQQVKHTLLLQYFMELPLRPDDEGLRRVVELLPDLNGRAVLGHFSVDSGRRSVIYRYVQALPAGEPITQSAVADVMVLVGYTPALFIALLEELIGGQLSMEQARTQLAAQGRV